MTQTDEDVIGRYLADFAQFEKQGGVTGHSWLERLRRTAMHRFEAEGWPARDNEEWRWTNLSPIEDTFFAQAKLDVAGARETARELGFGEAAACELVFVNGRFAAELSRMTALPAGVKVMPLASALRRDGDLIREHLAQRVKAEQSVFAAWNTAFFEDGALIHLARGSVVEKPIHILFISTAGASPTVSFPRILVVAEENAEASVVESYGGAGGVYLTNAVTEVVAARDARIDHCKVQQESIEAFHVAAMQVELAGNARFVSHSATLGGRLTRNGLGVLMNGEYADATLNGLVIIGGTQHVDNHTLLDHAKANCPSHELYKHVLDGRSAGVFKGQILVRPDAQKTDSKQTSKTLLLSDEASMNSQPALEIYADDVKCTHGSTTGPVDEDMVFYLRTRGVGLDAARHLLTYAFAADITRRIKVAAMRSRLEDYMAAQHGLPKDLRITDLGSHDEAAL